MGGFSELIKSFDKTRDYVRDFFIYGFKVRNDFGCKSARTYDDEKRRVESWLGDFLRHDDSKRGRQVSIAVNSGRIYENPLYKAYYSKSFTDNDMKLHFFITDILAGGGSFSLKEIVNRLADDYGEIFEEQTVRNKLKEYADEGIYIKSKVGKTDYFTLSEDTAESFFGAYDGLSDAVKCFSEMPEFGFAGNSLLKTAGLKNDIFLMKHNYIVHTLEDEIILEILNAIEDKRFIYFVNFSRDSRGNALENYVLPLKILTSVQTGRRYLTAYIPKYKRFNSFRLDCIKSVKAAESCENYDEIAETYIKCEKKCFGVSFGTRRELGNVEPLKITFRIDEKEEFFVVQRLEREKRCGKVERIDENLFIFTADVFDPNEVMHWAKTFIGKIVSIEGGNQEIRDKFLNDIIRMNRMYCNEKD